MPQRVWDESIIHSYPTLRNFFSESDAINQVLSRKGKRYDRASNPLNPNLAYKWWVCQIATGPFRITLGIVLHIVAKVSSLAGKNRLRTYTKATARFFITGFNVYSEEPTKLFWLRSSCNGPNAEGKVVNNNRFIPQAQVKDPKVKSRSFCLTYKGIKFNHHKGICRGMCDWFIYLYLNTKEQFSDPRSHMRALGKQFTSGGGQEATLLQSICLNKGKLLGLKLGTQGAHCRATALHEFLTPEWKSKKAEMINKLAQLPVGIYQTWVPKHATTYVKIHDHLGFFFDPNRGITEINGPSQGEKLYELISTTLNNTGEFPRASWNTIIINPVTRR